MKYFKFTCFLFASLISATEETTSNTIFENTSKQKIYSFVSYQWTNANLFEIGTVLSSPISSCANWNLGTNMNGGFIYLSQIDVSYIGFPPPLQKIIDAVRTEYDLLRSLGEGTLLSVFTEGHYWATLINGSIVTLTIHLQ